ncbi:hypothetical protein QUF70_15740, partial [Desulfobacterales bacterium HSG17]|nr:hypothetical protein [Desulfobacterales bacterium HSG17]
MNKPALKNPSRQIPEDEPILGKVVLKSISDEKTRKRVLGCLLQLSKKPDARATTEAVMANLPAVIAESISPIKGQNLATMVQKCGAHAEFVPNNTPIDVSINPTLPLRRNLSQVLDLSLDPALIEMCYYYLPGSQQAWKKIARRIIAILLFLFISGVAAFGVWQHLQTIGKIPLRQLPPPDQIKSISATLAPVVEINAPVKLAFETPLIQDHRLENAFQLAMYEYNRLFLPKSREIYDFSQEAVTPMPYSREILFQYNSARSRHKVKLNIINHPNKILENISNLEIAFRHFAKQHAGKTRSNTLPQQTKQQWDQQLEKTRHHLDGLAYADFIDAFDDIDEYLHQENADPGALFALSEWYSWSAIVREPGTKLLRHRLSTRALAYYLIAGSRTTDIRMKAYYKGLLLKALGYPGEAVHTLTNINGRGRILRDAIQLKSHTLKPSTILPDPDLPLKNYFAMRSLFESGRYVGCHSQFMTNRKINPNFQADGFFMLHQSKIKLTKPFFYNYFRDLLDQQLDVLSRFFTLPPLGRMPDRVASIVSLEKEISNFSQADELLTKWVPLQLQLIQSAKPTRFSSLDGSSLLKILESDLVEAVLAYVALYPETSSALKDALTEAFSSPYVKLRLLLTEADELPDPQPINRLLKSIQYEGQQAQALEQILKKIPLTEFWPRYSHQFKWFNDYLVQAFSDSSVILNRLEYARMFHQSFLADDTEALYEKVQPFSPAYLARATVDYENKMRADPDLSHLSGNYAFLVHQAELQFNRRNGQAGLNTL